MPAHVLEVFLPSQTKLSKTVINAYRVAHYRVKGPPEFVMLIKRKSSSLAALMKDHGVTSAAFVTAFNPYSQKAKEARNQRRNTALKREIEGRGFACYDGAGEDPSGQWKTELSFLVLGILLEEAKTIGKKYGQNAVVWAESDAVPQLVLLR